MNIEDQECKNFAIAQADIGPLAMQLALISDDAKRNPAQLAKDVDDAAGLVQHHSQAIRTTSYLLHPPMLDESAISPAMNFYVKGITAAAV